MSSRAQSHLRRGTEKISGVQLLELHDEEKEGSEADFFRAPEGTARIVIDPADPEDEDEIEEKELLLDLLCLLNPTGSGITTPVLARL